MTRRLRRLGLFLLLVGFCGALPGDGRAQPEELLEEAEGRIEPLLEIGGHTGKINQMAFSKDGKRLYTVGRPGEVMEWDVEEGQRLRVWRFPRLVTHMVLSPDGKRILTAGFGRTGNKDEQRQLPLWQIDLADGKVRALPTIEGNRPMVHGITIHPRGGRVLVNSSTRLVGVGLGSKHSVVEMAETGRLSSLAFSPTGRWVLAAVNRATDRDHTLRLFDPAQKPDRPHVTLHGAGWRLPKAAWSPDGTQVVNIHDAPGFQIWTVSGKPQSPDWFLSRKMFVEQLGEKAVGEGPWRTMGVAFRTKTEVVAAFEHEGQVRIVLIDLNRRKLELLPGRVGVRQWAGGFALSPDGRYLALGSNPAFRVAIYDLEDRKYHTWWDLESARNRRNFGPPLGRPSHVGWKKDGKGIVWNIYTDVGTNWAKSLTHGVNLDSLRFINKSYREKDVVAPDNPRDWVLERKGERLAYLVRPGKNKVPIDLTFVDTKHFRTFQDAAGKQRLVVVHAAGQRISIVDPESGEVGQQVGGPYSMVYDLAVSPNGKYLLVAGGDPKVDIFDLARPRFPLLHVLATRNDWIAWTREGYYAGTPNGEKLLGWKVTTDPDRPAVFYPVATFRKRFHRPEVIKEVLALGSVKAALNQAKEAEAKVEDFLPPRVDLEVTQDPNDRNKVTVQVKARALTKGQPIQQLRLMVDGRPLPDDVGVKDLGKGAGTAEVKWVLPNMPPGKLELKVLARCPDISGVSPAREVDVPGAVKARPVLHVIAVGIDYKGVQGLELKCAGNDARAIVSTFKDYCVGPRNLYGECKSHLITQGADAKTILDTLEKVRKGLRPQDLVVFYFAGHGVREGNDFYLITQGANLGNLPKTALSGDRLRESLERFPSQVLVLLDACHSGAAALALRKLKPATDDATRQLADESCGVALLAAAMGHETAKEPVQGGANGFFTGAIVEALKRGNGAPYNKRDGKQYVHHLWAEVLDEVQDKTGDTQHPFLSMPWTIEPFPIRRVR